MIYIFAKITLKFTLRLIYIFTLKIKFEFKVKAKSIIIF